MRWCGHLARYLQSPASKVLAIQDDPWLNSQRSSNSGSRPGICTEPGFVFRWSEGLHSAIVFAFGDSVANESGWKFKKQDKHAILEKAEFLRNRVHPCRDDRRLLTDQCQELVFVASYPCEEVLALQD